MTPRDLPEGCVITLEDGRMAVPTYIVTTWPEPMQRRMREFEVDLYRGIVLLPEHWEKPVRRVEHIMPRPGAEIEETTDSPPDMA